MNPMAAMKAYQAVQGGGMPTGGPAPTGAPGFGELLQNVMGDMTQQTRAAETQMTGAISGQNNMIDVVTAVSSAEASLETVIAVRDQVISAYQEIMRMPI
ncbi:MULTISPECIES: flagellar hook-basal body complex protein FliE [unclassified Brevundimonas]|uniref:flagellar hook-basal body complex protein FliE n=1 Tax=unclassified Brevundimonas TaxID=2622653 RepID=UPI001A2B8D37|nr:MULTISPECIES: flagellar hook-basal body complex protein FliE [unclassified Brevundimonas]MBJ7484233.1 flagellar hook-basal body complex protein FliE [Brevundimonas sp.]WGM46619.1 Flagellar hook-basal body complex protein FliE [Brevundimonas sp. NIBR10]